MILESAYSRLTEIGLVKRGVGSEAFSSLPARTRFADGTSRLGSVRLRRLAYLWDHIPSCREESQASYGAYEGGDMIDVGAYHGWYSVLLAPKSKPGDQFVSFDPDLRIYGELLAVLADLARLFPALGLWASPSPVADGSTVAQDQPTDSFGWQHPRFSESVTGQQSTTIDGMVNACGLEPRFVKIDVKGAEHSVLQGMQETLEKFHPTVMLELHKSFLPDGISPSEVEQLLLDHGYRCHPVGHDVRPQDIERQIWTPA